MEGDSWEILKCFRKSFINEIFEQRHSAENVKGSLWDFLTSIDVQNMETNEGETLRRNSKNFRKSRIVPKKFLVKNTKGGSLVCFRVSGRRCFCFGRGSGVPSMFWTFVVQVDVVEQMNNKTGTSQGTISKAQIKSKAGLFGDKKFRVKVAEKKQTLYTRPVL